jgi:hypothetical protein
MSTQIVLNVPRFKGAYDLDLDTEPFTNREWRWIKKISGYLPLTLEDGWEGRDPDLFIALAVIAMYRANRIEAGDALRVAETLADVPFDGVAIQLIATEDDDEEQGDEENPPEEPADEPATEPEAEPSPSSTGGSSRSTSVPSASGPRTIGVPVSER